MKSASALAILASCIIATGCSVRNDRIVERPATSTTTQRTTVTEPAPVPAYPAATTTTTTVR